MKTKINAFSLIELLVVMVIIGILAGIGIASFKGNIEKAKVAKNTTECAQVDRCEILKQTCETNQEGNCQNLCNTDNLCRAYKEFLGTNDDHIDVGAVNLKNVNIKTRVSFSEGIDNRFFTHKTWSGNVAGSLAFRGNHLQMFVSNTQGIPISEAPLSPNQVYDISVQYSPNGMVTTINGVVQNHARIVSGSSFDNNTNTFSIARKTLGTYGREFKGKIYSFRINGEEKIIPDTFD